MTLEIAWALQSTMERDPETKQAVFEALRRFDARDWGNVPPETDELNDYNTVEGFGVVTAKYETPTGGIFVIGYPGDDEEPTRVFYLRDFEGK